MNRALTETAMPLGTAHHFYTSKNRRLFSLCGVPALRRLRGHWRVMNIFQFNRQKSDLRALPVTAQADRPKVQLDRPHLLQRGHSTRWTLPVALRVLAHCIQVENNIPLLDLAAAGF